MARDDMNCTAIWYLGLLDTKRQAWLTAARAFEDGMGCYERTAGQTAELVKGFEARLDLDAGFRARRIAALETSVRELTSQQYAAAFNAANYYATGGNIPAARRLIEIAATDPALAEKVGKLREWLKDKTGRTRELPNPRNIRNFGTPRVTVSDKITLCLYSPISIRR